MVNERFIRERDLFFGYLVWALCFLGLAGMHRFYTGRIWTGLLWLATGGFCFIGQVIDLALIPYFCTNPKLSRRERLLLTRPKQDGSVNPNRAGRNPARRTA